MPFQVGGIGVAGVAAGRNGAEDGEKMVRAATVEVGGRMAGTIDNLQLTVAGAQIY
jgi:hypothetical protein